MQNPWKIVAIILTLVVLAFATIVLTLDHQQPVVTPTLTAVKPSDQPRPTVVLNEAAPKAQVATAVVGRYAAEVTVWKKPEGACYVSVDVPGWKTLYLDATGPICDRAKEAQRVIIQQSLKPSSPNIIGNGNTVEIK